MPVSTCSCGERWSMKARACGTSLSIADCVENSPLQAVLMAGSSRRRSTTSRFIPPAFNHFQMFRTHREAGGFTLAAVECEP